ncbi:MAG: hypothetical protein ACU83V_01520 [Gammaproteobacteria bacterium]
MSQDSIKLKLVGFSEFEAQNIESVLSLAERGLLKKWRIVTDPPVDYYLLPESLSVRMSDEDGLKSLPRDRCIFSSKEERRADSTGHVMRLSCDSRNVPRIRAMIDLFNVLCEETLAERKNQGPSMRTAEARRRNVTASAVAEHVPAAKPEDDKVFIPSQGFVGQLLASMNMNGLLRYELTMPNSPGYIYVYPEQQVFYSPASLDLLAPFFTCDEKLISCTSKNQVTEAELEQVAEAEDLKPYTLRSLLWYGVFKSSKGRLLEGSSAEKAVRLKRWPDLNLADCQELIKLAAFMQSNAASLQTIAEKTNIPMSVVNDFYNASEVVGLIEHCAEADIHKKQLNPEKTGLFSRIRSRLNKAHTA